MYWASTSILKMAGLMIVSMIIVAVFIEFLSTNKLSKYFIPVIGPMSEGLKGLLIFSLGLFLVGGIEGGYAVLHPNHIYLTDKIEYFNPYIGYHYWPNDDQFCTADGERITRERAWELFDETHDLVRDAEGNVIETYPKGTAPETEYSYRSEDCPYYLFNMTEEQESAYYQAETYVDCNSISRDRVYEWLTDEYMNNYSPEVASFAIEAIEENGKVDWLEECEEAVIGYTCIRTDFTREDVYNLLIEDGFTQDEAETAITNCDEQWQ